MNNMVFNAYAVTNEIDLNRIAEKCHIPKKYTWEEPLILQGETLHSILDKNTDSDQKVMVFSFGSIVFINIHGGDVLKFMEYLRDFEPDIDLKKLDAYSDDYELRITQDEEMELTDRYVAIPTYELFYPELIATVIAKSVALEKTEEQLGKILDMLEGIIDRLERGKLHVSDRELARTTARVIRHEYNTIAYIMILDKPDVTWSSSTAADFYDRMSEFFELSDRFGVLKSKTDILNDIINGFAAISRSIRSLFVEWIIILLIVVEVILMVVDLLK